jgi:hypothetical protein
MDQNRLKSEKQSSLIHFLFDFQQMFIQTALAFQPLLVSSLNTTFSSFHFPINLPTLNEVKISKAQFVAHPHYLFRFEFC